MSDYPVRDKNGEPIREGDVVCTRIRGGRHEGKVSEIELSLSRPRLSLCDFDFPHIYR
jgi:hypothetical protein